MRWKKRKSRIWMILRSKYFKGDLWDKTTETELAIEKCGT